MQTTVMFETDAFNTTQPRPYFINPGSYGDDVANWLMGELDKRTDTTAEGQAEQEDFGWYFGFVVDELEHTFVLGFRPDGTGNQGKWIGTIERSRGFLGSLLGKRHSGVSPAAVEAVNGVLATSGLINNVTWHESADADSADDSRVG